MILAGPFRLLALGVVALVGAGLDGAAAHSRPQHTQSPQHQGSYGASFFGGHHGAPIAFSFGRRGHERVAEQGFDRFSRGSRHGFQRYAASGHSGGGIQCVTFARADSGIELSGNANTWWYNAAGLYQRGNQPEAGSVLNFRANGAMRMGHVAVVNQVLNGRTIEIDHANWGGPGAIRGGISRDISVVDVSPNNDWSAVRVALGHSGEFGSIYPTYGFIYNRPDSGRLVTAQNSAAPLPALNPPPRDLRPRSDAFSFEEVAEAPDDAEPLGGLRHYARPRHHFRHALYASTAHHHRRA